MSLHGFEPGNFVLPGKHSATWLYPRPLVLLSWTCSIAQGSLEFRILLPLAVECLYMTHHDLIKGSLTEYENLLKRKPNRKVYGLVLTFFLGHTN